MEIRQKLKKYSQDLDISQVKIKKRKKLGMCKCGNILNCSRTHRSQRHHGCGEFDAHQYTQRNSQYSHKNKTSLTIRIGF